MKKILSLVLALIMMFGLCLGMVGCNGDLTGGEQPGGEQPGGEQPGGEQPGGGGEEQPGGGGEEQPGGGGEEQPGGGGEEQPGGGGEQQPGGGGEQQPGGGGEEQPGGGGEQQPGGGGEEQPGGGGEQQPGGGGEQQPGGGGEQQPGGEQGSDLAAFFAALKEIDFSGFSMNGKAVQQQYVAGKFTYESMGKATESAVFGDTLAIDLFSGSSEKGSYTEMDFGANHGGSGSSNDPAGRAATYALQDEVSQSYYITFMRGTDKGMVSYSDSIYSGNFAFAEGTDYSLENFIPLYQDGTRTLSYSEPESFVNPVPMVMGYLANPTVVQILLNIPNLFDGVLAETADGYTVTFDIVKFVGKIVGMASTIMGRVELTTTVNDLLQDETLVELFSTLFNGVKAADVIAFAEEIMQMMGGSSSGPSEVTPDPVPGGEMSALAEGEAEGSEGKGGFLPDALADEGVLDYLKRLASSTDFYQQISDMVGALPFEAKTFGDITVADVLTLIMGGPVDTLDAASGSEEEEDPMQALLDSVRTYLIQIKLKPAEYLLAMTNLAAPEQISDVHAEIVMHFDKNKAFTKLTADAGFQLNAVGDQEEEAADYAIYSVSGEISFQASVQDLTGMKYTAGYDYSKVKDTFNDPAHYFYDDYNDDEVEFDMYYPAPAKAEFSDDHKSVTVTYTAEGLDPLTATFDLSKDMLDNMGEDEEGNAKERYIRDYFWSFSEIYETSAELIAKDPLIVSTSKESQNYITIPYEYDGKSYQLKYRYRICINYIRIENELEAFEFHLDLIGDDGRVSGSYNVDFRDTWEPIVGIIGENA